MIVTINDYFDLEKIIESGQTFRGARVDIDVLPEDVRSEIAGATGSDGTESTDGAVNSDDSQVADDHVVTGYIYRFISCGKVLYIAEIDANSSDESDSNSNADSSVASGVNSDATSGDISTDDYAKSITPGGAIEHTYYTSCSQEDWDNYWYNYFDLNRNYSSIQCLDAFAQTCEKVSCGIRMLRQDPWEMLISFIISQRKSIPAIRSSIEAICTNYGTPIDSNNNLYYFPSNEQMLRATADELRECKLGYRVPYIQDAIDVISNDPTFLQRGYDMSDEALLEHLMTVKGVGIKVANCVALFAYGRTSLAPIDTWISKIINLHYDGKSPYEDYGDEAGIIQQYMFYYALTHKEEF